MRKFNEPIGSVIRAAHAEVKSDGMTKLEYFTAAAMQGILSNAGYIHNQEPVAAKWVADRSIIIAKRVLQELEIQEVSNG